MSDPPGPGGGLVRIRVIDDAPGLASSLAALLDDYGHVGIPTSSNFSALLSRPAWVGIDAALVDLQFHDRSMSGQVIVDWLATHAPAVRVVILTGSLTVKNPAPDGVAVLLKPATVEDVLAALGA